MKKLSELFVVGYGNKLDLNKMRRLSADSGGIDFVGRSSENNGITACVEPLKGVTPNPAGSITVALGGSFLLSAFVQSRPFYTAQNVAVLTPRVEVMLSFNERVFLCVCIRHNRFRYSAFGREANRTLRDIVVPEPGDFPAWVGTRSIELEGIANPAKQNEPFAIAPDSWRPFRLDDLFAVKKGRRLIRRERGHGSTPFIGAAKRHNGIVGYVDSEPMFRAGSITIPYNGEGATGFALYQPGAFCASDDVQVLEPLPARASGEIDQAALMFVCVVLRRERYRYSFGRKWHLQRMKESTIRLPVTNTGAPDWAAMSRFVQSLPFSAAALDADER